MAKPSKMTNLLAGGGALERALTTDEELTFLPPPDRCLGCPSTLRAAESRRIGYCRVCVAEGKAPDHIELPAYKSRTPNSLGISPPHPKEVACSKESLRRPGEKVAGWTLERVAEIRAALEAEPAASPKLRIAGISTYAMASTVKRARHLATDPAIIEAIDGLAELVAWREAERRGTKKAGGIG